MVDGGGRRGYAPRDLCTRAVSLTLSLSIRSGSEYTNTDTQSKKIGIRSYSIGGTIGKGPVGRGEGEKEKTDRRNN